MNKRIQRKRTKGWTTPENVVYVGRPTKFGNPYNIKYIMTQQHINEDNAREIALKWYREALECKLRENPHYLDELVGKDLMCWCRLDKPCHVDILLEFINRNNHKIVEY